VTTAEALAAVREAMPFARQDAEEFGHTQILAGYEALDCLEARIEELERATSLFGSRVLSERLGAAEARIAEQQDTIDELLARNGDLERERDEAVARSERMVREAVDAGEAEDAAEARLAAYERVAEAASVQPGSDLTSVGHWTARGVHWYDPRSTPMPGCALCAALAALKEQA
jgi:predicted  nucleic acid-binding Zn-ribbon protein